MLILVPIVKEVLITFYLILCVYTFTVYGTIFLIINVKGLENKVNFFIKIVIKQYKHYNIRSKRLIDYNYSNKQRYKKKKQNRIFCL